MKDNLPTQSPISRRKFLTTLGIAAGASALSPGFPSLILKDSGKKNANKLRASISGEVALKIGILLPASNIYPAMSDNLMAGLRLYFDKNDYNAGGREIHFLETPVGFGPASVVQKARSLIESQNADIVTGIVDMAVNKELRQLFHDQHRILIANQVGANLIHPEDNSPYIIHNSLDMWQANWEMGNWAAQNLGKKAFVCASFYESGYDALYAFNLGFENSGGKIIQTVVNNLPNDEKNLKPLIQSIDKNGVDLVFAAYSGEEAVEFIQAYHQYGPGQHIPLLGSGFIVDETHLPALGAAALGITTCFPWSSSLNQVENLDFSIAFKDKYNRLPDPFAVLGFETAQLITTAVNNLTGDFRDIKLLGSPMAKISLKSPRGQLSVNTTSKQITSPLYLRKVQGTGTQISNEIFEQN